MSLPFSCFHPRVVAESVRNEKLDVSDWGAENDDPDEEDEGSEASDTSVE